jgi:hypothetical protein
MGGNLVAVGGFNLQTICLSKYTEFHIKDVAGEIKQVLLSAADRGESSYLLPVPKDWSDNKRSAVRRWLEDQGLSSTFKHKGYGDDANTFIEVNWLR